MTLGRAVGFFVVMVVSMACDMGDAGHNSNEEVEPVTTQTQCQGAVGRLVDSTVVVSATGSTECTVSFVEVLRLAGSVDGVAPRPPIVSLRDGSFVTATFQPGQIAHWGVNGELVGVFGKGVGDGPGEFARPADLVELPDGSIAILTGRPTWHEYALNGRHLRSRTLFALGGLRAGTVVGDRSFFLSMGELGPVVWRVEADSMVALSQLSPGTLGLLAGSDAAGLWVAQDQDYRLMRVDLHSGNVGRSIERVADWFPRPSDGRANLYRVDVDPAGRIWVLISAEDPDAPEGLMPPVSTMEEAAEVTNRYRDTRLEVFSRDGRLLASEVFERIEDAPEPIGNGHWYRRDTDPLESVILLKPQLLVR